ncbi:transglutaminase domain-containing protein [Caldithrix abyssi DSM 13497]|uniref:Glutamine cyclotransferase n=1 Tax=Caldithrix abyssi DSM 13497 TaxID=880073 RepID=H1XNY7_CALAY|nr:glutaminyl-peptide cyclotransferase [Caldithrix abyssi]APF20497.1 Glutamine cyclotransferase [Caldithrix abyssi DSM 13497]EHO40979.1 transglutaminase domain-containing protein [Caldithrix abyssi DSM 13497]
MRLLNSVLILLVALTVTWSYPGKMLKKIATPGKFCTGLTFDGKFLWVADYKADQIFKIDPESGKVVHQIPSPGFWPMGLAWDGKHLWNVDAKAKKIYKLDAQSGQILTALDAPSADPQGLTWDGQTLWISDARKNRIMSLDLSDGTAVKRYKGPAKRVNGLTFDGKYLWASDRLQNEIYMIDPQNGEIILIIDAPGPYARGLAFDGKNLWCVDYQNDQLYQLVRKDDEKFRLKDKRHARITLTDQVNAYGSGSIHSLEFYIAVPQELPNQKILKKSFTPQRFKMVQDQWNQPVALFHFQDIQANAKVEVQMTVEAEIYAIDYFIFPEDVGSLQDIPTEIRQRYTADGGKYLLNDPYIQKTAREIIGNERHPYWMARKIFDFVRNQLEYKLEGGWNAAPVVLQRQTGSCSEYTFSFIALCRAVGLPARYVGAIVVRGDDASMDEVFHRWPQVYLPNYGWVHIDPQGGDKPVARDRAMNIGHLSNRFLITTLNGGDSKYLGWYYNYNQIYQCDPQLKIEIETFAEWEPLEN